MSGVSITQFPNLHAYTVSNSKRDERIATCIPDFDLSESLIYIAWAELLKGYTGLEQITFLSDDRFIHVDTSSREAQKESYIPNTKDEAPNSGSNATGVYFRKVCLAKTQW